MTASAIYRALQCWLASHQAVHGPLTNAELELVKELTTFLVDCSLEAEVCGCSDASRLSEALRGQEEVR